MKKYLYLLLCFVFVACSENETVSEKGSSTKDSLKTIKQEIISSNQLFVYGSFKNIEIKQLKIMKTTKSGKFLEVGESSVESDGSFSLIVPKAENRYYQLFVNDTLSKLIYGDADSIGVFYSDNAFTVVGSKETSVLWQLIEYNECFNEKFDALNLKRMSSKNVDKINQEIENLRLTGVKGFKSLLLATAPSRVGLDYSQDFISSGIELNEYLSELLDKNESNNDYPVYKMIEAYLKLTIGATASNFEAIDINENIVSLDQLKGKYVLLDFWATWCRPCMAEVPTVKKAYSKYKQDGFEIIGVSQDRNPDQWKSGVHNHKMNWIQVLDKGTISQLYQISSIPSTFLLDKEGVIIAKNLRGPQLEQKLKEVFKH